MALHVDMPAIEAAIDAESFDWLDTAAPELARAVAEEVDRGRTPDQIRRFVLRKTNGREKLADRCQQAARHLARLNGGSR